MMRHLAAVRGPAILLALVVLVGALVAAAAPRLLVRVGDAEASAALASLDAERTDLQLSGRLGSGGPTAAKLVESGLESFVDKLPEPLRGAVGEPEWFAVGEAEGVEPALPQPRRVLRLSLAVDPDRDRHLALVEGRDPAAWEDEDAHLEVGLTTTVASALQLGVGDTVALRATNVEVTGLYEPRDPEEGFWNRAGAIARGSSTDLLTGFTLATGAALIDPAGLALLGEQLASADVHARVPFRGEGLTLADLELLGPQLHTATSRQLYLETGEAFVVQSRLTSAVEQTIDRVRALTAILSLAASAPLGTLAATIVLAARSLLRAQSARHRLLVARGASAARLRLTALGEGLVIGLPGAVIATVGTAALLPADAGVPAWAAPLAPTLATAILLASGVPTRPLEPGGRAPRTLWRNAAEGAVLLVTILAVLLLVRRGLTAGGLDPMLVAAPLLLSLSTCLLVLRLHPLPLRALLAAARRRRGPLALLGAARAVRAPAHGFAAVLAIVIGVSAATSSLVLGATVEAGVASAAREAVGADLRATGDAVDLERLADDPALTGAVLLSVSDVQQLRQRGRTAAVTVVSADAAALARLLPEASQLTGAGDGVPALFSAGLAGAGTRQTATIGDVELARRGSVPDGALPGLGDAWLLVDESRAAELLGATPEPTLLLADLAPGLTPAPTAAQVVTAHALATATLERPALVGLRVGLLGGAALALLAGTLALVLGTVAGAPVRARELGVLRLLGMPLTRARRLLVWELGPLTVTAVLAGTGLGLALPWFTTAVIDLRAFVGGTGPVTPVIPVALVAGAVLVVALTVAAVGAAAAFHGSRTRLTDITRMGAQ